jgi:hypothetical protein
MADPDTRLQALSVRPILKPLAANDPRERQPAAKILEDSRLPKCIRVCDNLDTRKRAKPSTHFFQEYRLSRNHGCASLGVAEISLANVPRKPQLRERSLLIVSLQSFPEGEDSLRRT